MSESKNENVLLRCNKCEIKKEKKKEFWYWDNKRDAPNGKICKACKLVYTRINKYKRKPALPSDKKIYNQTYNAKRKLRIERFKKFEKENGTI